MKRIARLLNRLGLSLFLASFSVCWAEIPRLPEAFHSHKSNQWTLLDFYSPFCGTCQAMTPHLEQLGKKLKGHLNVAHINLETEGDAQKWAAFKIQGTPTYVLYTPQGDPAYKMETLISPLVLERQILRFQNRLQPVHLLPEFEQQLQKPPRLSTEDTRQSNKPLPPSTSLANLVLLSFETADCKPCQQMAPYLQAFQQAGKPHLQIITIQANTQAGQKLVNELGITRFPAFALLDNALIAPETPRGLLYLHQEKLEPKAVWEIIRSFSDSGLESTAQ